MIGKRFVLVNSFFLIKTGKPYCPNDIIWTIHEVRTDSSGDVNDLWQIKACPDKKFLPWGKTNKYIFPIDRIKFNLLDICLLPQTRLQRIAAEIVLARR